MQQQAIVTDRTRKTKSLFESVKSDLNKCQKLSSQSVSDVLDDKISPIEWAKTLDLEITTSDIIDYSSKLRDQFKQTNDSTIVGTGGKIAHHIGISQEAIKKINIMPPGNNKDNENWYLQYPT